MHSVRRRWMGILLLMGIALWGWNFIQGPRVKLGPDDIVLRAVVKPADPSVCSPDVAWVLEVTLDRTNGMPLHALEGYYTHAVHVFDGERPLDPDDYGQGCDRNGQVIAYQLFGLGNYGPRYAAAVEAAVAVGGLPPEYPPTRSEGSGFTYLWSSFPAVVRYYIRAPQTISQPFTAVYVHQENGGRWRKDRFWSKTVRVKP